MYLIIIEGILLGSGRVIEINIFSLRMLLFTVAILYSLLFLLVTGVKKKYFLLVIFYAIFLLLFPAFIGAINGGETTLIFDDIKPLSYFLIIPFFSNTISNKATIIQVNKIIKLCSFCLLIAYFVLIILIQMQFINFIDIYIILSESGDSFFRGDQGYFFYKGFIYLCIGLFFFILNKNILSKIIAILFLIGITLTFTRGFIIFTAIIIYSYLLYSTLKSKKIFTLKSLFFLFFPLIALPQLLNWFLDNLGDKIESDSVRLLTIDQVFDNLNPLSLFIGHGFGIGVPLRPVHMEISYLEIFHKQGIIGILWWLFVLLTILFKFQKACKNGYSDLATPYLLASIFVYLQSLTNPFINNPIGMLIIIISIVCLDVLSKPQKYNNLAKSSCKNNTNKI